MTRMIILTFAALGWCFYVMSGGPDFEPPSQRAALPDTAEPQRVANVPAPAPQPERAAQIEKLVTKVAVRAEATRATPEPVILIDETEIATETASLETLSGFSSFADTGANLTLASLEDGAIGLQQIAVTDEAELPAAAPAPEPEKDIREISGTRVNMRDGPGTIYPIIGKATIGQKVEILSESGTGWLRLRVLPAQQVGWVSASLVRKTSN